jgi:protein TonB
VHLERAVPGGAITAAVPRDNLQALMLALGLEVVLIILAVIIYSTGILKVHPSQRDVVTLQLDSLVPEPKPAAPEPPKPIPKIPPPPVKKAAPPPPEPLPEPKPEPVVQTPQPTEKAAPTPFVEPAPPPPARATTTRTDADLMAIYSARIRAAVQASLVFPFAARELNSVGRTRVEFKLEQGRHSGEHVLISSGMSILDKAALQAVRDAIYPPPPAGLQAQSYVFQIWVEFAH